MAGPATVRDVARLANVSAATVSRALSASDLVAPHTRQRILEAAGQLGYLSSSTARSQGGARTGNLGLLVPDLENPYFASVTKGVQARGLASGYSVFVADSDEDPRAELELVRKLAPRVDGMILCSARMSDEDLQACVSETQIVLVNRTLAGVDNIYVDDSEIIRQALEHLYALGHRDVAYAGGPSGSWSDRQRRQGIERVLPELAGLSVTSLGAFAPNFGGGESAADLAIASGSSAVLAYNDLVALGILSRLRSRGIAVPEDISVVGIDDINAATLVTPALTTVAAPLRRVGRAAVNLLVDHLQPDSSPRAPEQLPVQLIVRQSTSTPSTSRSMPMSRDGARHFERTSNANI